MGSLANVGLSTIPTYKTLYKRFYLSRNPKQKRKMHKTIAIFLLFVVVTTVSCKAAGKKVSQDLAKPDDESDVKVDETVQAENDAKAATNLAAAPEIEAMFKQLMESQDEVTKLRDGESGAVSTLKSALKTLLETTMNEFFYGMVPSVK